MLLHTQSETASTSSKIEDFIDSTLPVILNHLITVHSNYISVGMFNVVSRSDGYAVMIGHKRLSLFNKKSWAVAYAYAKSVHKHSLATKIEKLQDNLTRLTADKDVYEYHIDRGSSNYRVFQDRTSRCLTEIDLVEQQFSRIIRSVGIV